MSPLELQHRLEKVPSRAVQTLIFRCLDSRSPAECAALYGIGIPQWEILFFEAAQALADQTVPLPELTRRTLATQLQAELANPVSRPLAVSAVASALILHRQAVRQLLEEAERAAAQSPARAREEWLRRLAIALIIAASLFVWIRERNRLPPPSPSHFPSLRSEALR